METDTAKINKSSHRRQDFAHMRQRFGFLLQGLREPGQRSPGRLGPPKDVRESRWGRVNKPP